VRKRNRGNITTCSSQEKEAFGGGGETGEPRNRKKGRAASEQLVEQWHEGLIFLKEMMAKFLQKKRKGLKEGALLTVCLTRRQRATERKKGVFWGRTGSMKPERARGGQASLMGKGGGGGGGKSHEISASLYPRKS